MPNISIEDSLVRGYRDPFWLGSRDSTVRDAYRADEAHQGIGARNVTELEGGAEGVFVLDLGI